MDEKRKRLIAHALNEATRGCNCGMGVAECDRCREVVLVEALEEALFERDEWRQYAKFAAGELCPDGKHPCGDERHCTCVGPLRKELRDTKAKLSARAEDYSREDLLVDAIDEAQAKLAKVVASFDAYLNSEDEDRVAEWIALCESIKAAKVQP